MALLRLLLLLVITCLPAWWVHAQLTYATLQVQYDSIWQYKNLALIPIKLIGQPPAITRANDGNMITLQQGLDGGKVKLKEIYYDNGADVSWLNIINQSKQAVLVTTGELLSGGKQDRMVGETKILLPGESDYIKVYCVEKGRWDNKPKAFAPAGNADVMLKKVMDLTRRQADVWKEIERQFGAANRQSVTWPYLQLQQPGSATDSAYLQYFTQRFSQSDSLFAGFLAISGPYIINCELFASPVLTAKAYGGMVKGLIPFAMATGSQPTVPLSSQKNFMDQLLQSEAQQKAFIAAHGQLHLYQGRVIHLVAYGN